ncbi:hypothetical protein [Tropicimonas isoalkanivorans]|uniref:Uncharacterized protein n=1 Tax=Tropicimonas isoalkanivorans TaxID=441112 RepID=A0A1I1NX46_9RHOB|nr:hypothetical protein [Tropicimonas isoalkanivorans]SFC99293.1 hypothetical protein SAMN04488094_112172 [Tropicimonas isoalkanivorans]
MRHVIFAAAIAAVSAPVAAQDHSQHMNAMGAADVAPGAGQAAFAVIQDTVADLMADPDTDWTRVDIDALREHLVDMDNVTLRSRVEARDLENGAEFRVMSGDPDVTASIRRMVSAHAETMTGFDGLQQVFEILPDGAVLRVTGAPEQRDLIQGLGFFGILTLGTHHGAHHLAIARGDAPHEHGQ